jgi:uncharacterized membrane protein YphA (DoxX/SURF4 family)
LRFTSGAAGRPCRCGRFSHLEKLLDRSRLEAAYFTGAIEIPGGVLVLIPATVTIGLALLACTMASAALILIFVIHRPQDSVFSGLR